MTNVHDERPHRAAASPPPLRPSSVKPPPITEDFLLSVLPTFRPITAVEIAAAS
ncbi:hypothetical protein [Nonomuraea dietziae]|uniref:hypothetical protein n=1 Tax=Nonomuraea dietziae TaxID=65515 RepID=UPI00340DE513